VASTVSDLEGQRAPVDFVADGRRLGADDVAIAQTGAVEQPVLGFDDCVAAGAARHGMTHTVVATARERQPDRRVLDAADQRV
jgi:hypothetical protein